MKYRAAIVGATGMVGQRFITLLHNHPWFEISALVASGRSAGRTYAQAVEGRWKMPVPIPDAVRDMVVMDSAQRERVAECADFIFCAVDMPKAEIRAMEEAFARLETPVVSNNSACRGVEDVPMLVPEINGAHTRVIEAQRKRLGTRRGFIACKPNCSIQGYVPALTPLRDFGLSKISVCTYQAVSGAGKTLETWPEMVDNVIPFIGGEEQKSEVEPLKIWGSVENGVIVPATSPIISAQCYRVPVSDGHMAAVSVSFDRKPPIDEIYSRWESFEGLAGLGLPSAPKKFLTVFREDNRPQTRLDRDLENGMGISWAACARIAFSIINSPAFRTTRCAAQLVARC